MNLFKLKIISGGGKLFLYFPDELRKIIKFPFGTLVKIVVRTQKSSFTLITKYNYNITLKKEAINDLSLRKGDFVEVEIFELPALNKPDSPFVKGLIDMVFFIPENSKKGSKFHFEIFDNFEEEFIRIVSIHKRGSSTQISLRRYADPKFLGLLLGQIQSEGTKTNYNSLEFCNKSFYEIKDFISYLEYFGISKETLSVKLDYHSSFKEDINKIALGFQKSVGMKVNYFSESSKSRGGYGFKIIKRNVVLSEVFLNSLVKMRAFISHNNFDGAIKTFCEGYLSKILSGDGSFEITSRKRKKFQSRLVIADGNEEYLAHYDLLLRKFGFNPKINKKFGYIRSMCNLNLAEKLIDINAFENNPNRQKIISFVGNNKAQARKSGT